MSADPIVMDGQTRLNALVDEVPHPPILTFVHGRKLCQMH